MSPSLVLLASLFQLHLLGDLDVRGEAALSAGQGVRSIHVQDGDSAAVGQLDLAPRLTLYGGARPRVVFTYAPTFSLPVGPADAASGGGQVVAAPTSSALHSAQLSLEAPLSRWRVFASGQGSWGTTDLITAQADASAPDAVATRATLPYVSGQLAAGATFAANRRTALSLQAAAFFSGGTDEEARAAFPLQRGARAEGSVAWNVARRDVLALQLSVLGSRVGDDSDGDALVGRAGGTWAHSLSRRLLGRVGAGAASVFSDGAAAGQSGSLLGWAEASLAYAGAAAQPSASLRLSAEPGVDRLTGLVQMRVGADGGVSWEPFRRWSFAGLASIATLDTYAGPSELDGAIRVARGEARAGREVARDVWLYGSLAAAVQSSARPDAPSFTELGAFLRLEARLFSL